MKNILITGGAGFIGSSVALKLVERGLSVTVLDNLSPQIYGDTPDSSYTYALIKDKVRFVQGDVCNPSDWQNVLPGQDAVLHLAAETGTGQSMYQVDHYSQVNVRGTSLFLDYLVNGSHTIKKVVVASSRSIYGEGKYTCAEHGVVYPEARKSEDMLKGEFEPKCPICNISVTAVPTDESSQLKPASVYAVTKLTQEQLTLAVAASKNIAAFALRYQNVYGPGQSLLNPYTGILSIFSTALFNDKPINIFEDGLESRDFVYVDDVAEATVRALLFEGEGQYSLNVGAGEATTVIDVLKALAAAYGLHADYKVTGNFRAGDIRHNFADISRLEKVLGFKPGWTFADGIQQFANWVKAEKDKAPLVASGYEKSLDEMRQKGLLK
jgi:dTDP-L-rhamnose 4-epimerase